MNPLLWSLPAHVRPDTKMKLFFAVRPDGETGTTIEKLGATLKRAHRLHGRAIARERLHNTLAAVHDPGTIHHNIARAKAIGDRIRHRSFAVRFDWTGSFRGHDSGHPFVLRGEEGLEPLSAFRQTLRARMVQAGLPWPPASHLMSPCYGLTAASRNTPSRPSPGRCGNFRWC
jgi:2'-5' RNA ligase